LDGYYYNGHTKLFFIPLSCQMCWELANFKGISGFDMYIMQAKVPILYWYICSLCFVYI